MSAKENYSRFINLAVAVNDNGGSMETYTFTLEGLMRIVDAAFAEGKLSELESDPNYVDNPDKVNLDAMYRQQIENAIGLTEEMVEGYSEMPVEGE